MSLVFADPDPSYMVPCGSVPRSLAGGVGDVTSSAPGTAARFNTGKAPLDLVPLRAMADFYDADGRPCSDEAKSALHALYYLAAWQESGDKSCLVQALRALGDGWTECAHVFDYGRKKYAAWNWAKGFDWSVPLACAARHLRSIIDGESTDPESGLAHRGHVFCNVSMLLTFIRTWPSGDDRSPMLASPL